MEPTSVGGIDLLAGVTVGSSILIARHGAQVRVFAR